MSNWRPWFRTPENVSGLQNSGEQPPLHPNNSKFPSVRWRPSAFQGAIASPPLLTNLKNKAFLTIPKGTLSLPSHGESGGGGGGSVIFGWCFRPMSCFLYTLKFQYCFIRFAFLFMVSFCWSLVGLQVILGQIVFYSGSCCRVSTVGELQQLNQPPLVRDLHLSFYCSSAFGCLSRFCLAQDQKNKAF